MVEGLYIHGTEYMKRWYSFYAKSDEIRHQVGDELEFPANFSLVPWRHHISIFTKSNSGQVTDNANSPNNKVFFI